MPRGVMPRQPSRSGRQDKVPSNPCEPKPASRKRRARAGKERLRLDAEPARILRRGVCQKSARRSATTRSRRSASAKSSSAWTSAIPTRSARCITTAPGSCWSQPSSPRSAPTSASTWSRPALFQKYPTPEAFAALKPDELENDIRSTGFFRNKSKSVVGAARKLIGDFGGEVPRTMDELLQLPGVARKTANVVLGTWFGSPTAWWWTPTCNASRAAWS